MASICQHIYNTTRNRLQLTSHITIAVGISPVKQLALNGGPGHVIRKQIHYLWVNTCRHGRREQHRAQSNSNEQCPIACYNLCQAGRTIRMAGAITNNNNNQSEQLQPSSGTAMQPYGRVLWRVCSHNVHLHRRHLHKSLI